MRNFILQCTEKRKNVDQRLVNSIRAACYYSKEQSDALCGYRPMTRAIFESCLDVCARIGDADEYSTIVQQFPELAMLYTEEINAKIRGRESNG